MGNPSLPAGRDLFRRTVIGGVDQQGPIVDGTPEEVRAEVQQAIREMGTVGFMIGAGCTVPGDIPIENLVVARQAVLG